MGKFGNIASDYEIQEKQAFLQSYKSFNKGNNFASFFLVYLRKNI